MMLWKRTYERGYRDGMREGARIALEAFEETIRAMEAQREAELAEVSPGGTDCGDE